MISNKNINKKMYIVLEKHLEAVQNFLYPCPFKIYPLSPIHNDWLPEEVRSDYLYLDLLL